MGDDTDYGDALRHGLRRAAIHWLRASYEVVAGVGALLDEVAQARRNEPESSEDDEQDDGPVRIELD
jgi:hypothetical protein